MTQRNLLKLLFILAVTVMSCMLILPTVGRNEIDVVVQDGTSAADIEKLKVRFPSKDFDVVVEGTTITVSGYGLNNAVMNEVLNLEEYPYVKEAKFRPHWAEGSLLAKRITLGLDLQGGSMLVLQADYEAMKKKMNRDLTDADKMDISNQALDMIRNRIDKFGVTEPLIRLRGIEQIELQLPGVRDPKKIKELLGMTGQVEYRLCDESLTKTMNDYIKEKNISFIDPNTPIDTLLATLTTDLKFRLTVKFFSITNAARLRCSSLFLRIRLYLIKRWQCREPISLPPHTEQTTTAVLRFTLLRHPKVLRNFQKLHLRKTMAAAWRL